VLLDLEALVPRLPTITGVVHVGCHLAEEAETYQRLGIPKVWWVEANPDLISKINGILTRFPGQELLFGLCLDPASVGNARAFRITNYDGMSSSVYQWGTHTQFSPDTVIERVTHLMPTTLDTLEEGRDFSGCNMLNIDVEGATLDVLRGAQHTLKQMDILYLEVQTENVYDGAPLLGEVVDYLNEEFIMIDNRIIKGQGWGDAVWTRK
jgi:FkbM family methyltransferase